MSDELLGNPIARAAFGDSRPLGLLGKIALFLLRAVVALAFVAIATIPFAILIGLFTDAASGNWWALACAILTVGLSVVMGAGRRKAPT